MTWTSVFVVSSLLFCAPFVTLDRLDHMPDRGDARLNTWTLAWHARWPTHGGFPLDAPFFAPERGALANSEAMIALGVLTAPITMAAGPVVAFNVLRLLLPATNALAMAWLVWHYTRSQWAAVVAGVTLGFAYSQVATVYLGLIQLAVLAGFALAPLWIDRWWRGGARRELAAAVGIACVQALVSWYAAIIMVIVLIVQVAWLIATEGADRTRTRGRIASLLVAGAIAAAILWPFARSVTGMSPPSAEEVRRFSLQPSWYLWPPLDTWAGALMNGTVDRTTAWDYRRSYFPGAAASVAALVGACAALRFPDARRMLWVVPLGLLGFALSLGPSGPDTFWRPFDLLSMIPGVWAFRAPGRMAVLVALAIAVLNGMAVFAVPARRRPVVGALLVACLVAESLMVFRPCAAESSLPSPGIFARLAAANPSSALVVPMLADTPEWPAEADYLLFAQPAWTPLVNGYGRRTPPIYNAVLDAVATFPKTSLGDTLRFYGVSHVVVLPHYDRTRAAAFRQAADASRDFERVAQVGDDVLYRVRPAALPGSDRR